MFDGECGINLEPMQGNRASSRVNFGYTELFHVAVVTSGSHLTCDCSWRLSGVPSSKSRLFTCLMGNTELLCMQCRGIGPHLGARGKSHGFSRVAVGTCGIFSSYGGDGSSKLMFVQPRQNSCLVTRDTPVIS